MFFTAMKMGRPNTQVHLACAYIVGIPYFIGQHAFGHVTRFECNALGRQVSDDAAPQRCNERDFTSPVGAGDGLSIPIFAGHGKEVSSQKLKNRPICGISQKIPEKGYDMDNFALDEETKAASEALLAIARTDQTFQKEKKARKRPLDVSSLDIGSPSFQEKYDLPLKRPQWFHNGGSRQSQSFIRDAILRPVAGSPKDSILEKNVGAPPNFPLDSFGQQFGFAKEDLIKKYHEKRPRSYYTGVKGDDLFGLNSRGDDSSTGTGSSIPNRYHNQLAQDLSGPPATFLPPGYTQDKQKIGGKKSTMELFRLPSMDQSSRSKNSQIAPISDKIEKTEPFQFQKYGVMHLSTKDPEVDLNIISEGNSKNKLLKIQSETCHHQFQQIKTLSVQVLDPKLLVCIASIPCQIVGHEKELVQELKSEFQELIHAEKFKLKWLFSEFERKEDKNSAHSLHVMNELLEQVWVLNRNFISRFKSDFSDVDYLKGQIELQNWILNVIISLNLENCVLMVSNQPQDSIKFGNQLDIQKTIYHLLHSETDGVYWEMRNHIRGKLMIRYDRHIINLTDSAMKIIGAYYKSTNNTKWDALFPSDINFYYILGNIRWRCFIYASQYWNSIKHPEGVQFFPWKDEWPKGISERVLLKDYGKSIRRMISNVIEVKRETWYSKYKNQSDWISPSPDIFHWLSLNQKGVQYIDAAALNRTYERICAGLKMLSIRHQVYKRLTTFMKDFSKLVWAMNSQILRALGTEIPSESFFEEQKFLQKWLQEHSLIQARILTAEASVQKCHEFDLSDTSYIGKVLFRSVANSKSPLAHKSSSKKSRCISLIRSHGSEITKAMVILINSYYQQKNYNKWRKVFLDEKSFLRLIVQIYKEASAHNICKNSKKRKKLLKGLNLIPWEINEYVPTKSSQELLMKALHSLIYKNSSF